MKERETDPTHKSKEESFRMIDEAKKARRNGLSSPS